MGLFIKTMKYDGNNLGFLEKAEEWLISHEIDPANALYRASEVECLDRILSYGTDRGGFPERKLWSGSAKFGREILHEDVIYATNRSDIERAEVDDDFTSSLTKFDIIDNPLLLVYDVQGLELVAEKQYVFIDTNNKRPSLLAMIFVDKVLG